MSGVGGTPNPCKYFFHVNSNNGRATLLRSFIGPPLEVHKPGWSSGCPLNARQEPRYPDMCFRWSKCAQTCLQKRARALSLQRACLVVQRHFVLKHGEYKPDAQASESAQLIHSLAIRACTVLPSGAVQLECHQHFRLRASVARIRRETALTSAFYSLIARVF